MNRVDPMKIGIIRGKTSDCPANIDQTFSKTFPAMTRYQYKSGGSYYFAQITRDSVYFYQIVLDIHFHEFNRIDTGVACNKNTVFRDTLF